MMGSSEPFLHDILRPGLDIVFVGAAPSLHSARIGHWYAGPTNRFYSLLYRAGFTPRTLLPEEDSTLPEYGIGLTCLFPYLCSSANHLLPEPDDAVRATVTGKLMRYAPRIICYNGKDVYRMHIGRECPDWGEQPGIIGVAKVFVVHSSSARADRWGAERLALYRELRALRDALRQEDQHDSA
ncbi:MAG: mismatch-specific DNA-glycosylase [Chloroherpetonaceae bacterium]|nr:mismatch-specific DNA-glycosylase [Chthonomonadaceae bacterium]MDW8207556.1 mismatch-specific DNA-glycosylase [Chloroherpetonaceae bacterium]